jgi:tetratricopeptide (TPR) repeat protein
MSKPCYQNLLPGVVFLFALPLSTVPFLTSCVKERDVKAEQSAAKSQATSDSSATLFKAPAAPSSPLPAEPSPSVTSPSVTSTAAPGCEDLYQKIRKFHDTFPVEFGSIRGEEADKLAAETEKTVVDCARFELECAGPSPASAPQDEPKEAKPAADKTGPAPAAPAGKSPKACEVTFVHSKLLYLLSERQRYKWMLELKEKGVQNLSAQLLSLTKSYMDEVRRLARSAYECLPKDHPFHARSLQLLGQASADGQDPKKAREAYEALIVEEPKYEDIAKIRLALARACLDMEDFDRGIDVVNQALKDHYTSDQYPYFVEVLWKLYHTKGDLDGMEKVTRLVDTVYPLKLSNLDLGRPERENYERFLGFNGFRKGYTLFGKGDFVGARSAFSTNIEELDAAEAALEKKGQQLKPELKIYRQRSRDNLTFLDKLAGLPPTLDFDLDGAWGTQKKVTLAEARNKVVAIVFRGVGDERSSGFLGPVSQFCARQPDMEMVVVSYQRSGENIEKQLDSLREDLSKLGFEGAAGYDPDGDGKKLFRAYQANVGSATFLVANRQGEIVWFMQDPRGVDTRFAEAILKLWAMKS